MGVYTFNIIVLVIASMAAALILVLSLSSNLSAQQTVSVTKQFAFCPDNVLFDNNTYNDGTQLRFRINGCPMVIAEILDWQNISEINRLDITAKLQAAGYEEIQREPILVCPEDVIDDGTGRLVVIDEDGRIVGNADPNACVLESVLLG